MLRLSSGSPCRRQHRRGRALPLPLLPLRFRNPPRQTSQEHRKDAQREVLSQARHLRHHPGPAREGQQRGQRGYGHLRRLCHGVSGCGIPVNDSRRNFFTNAVAPHALIESESNQISESTARRSSLP